MAIALYEKGIARRECPRFTEEMDEIQGNWPPTRNLLGKRICGQSYRDLIVETVKEHEIWPMEWLR